MKLEKLYLIYIGVVLVVLVVIGALVAGASVPVGEDAAKMIDVMNTAADFSVLPSEAEKGTDGVIHWMDPGMEAHIRFLLDRPEGDILRSDVWNIRLLSLYPSFGTPFDSAQENPTGEVKAFTSMHLYGSWKRYGGKTFPPVESLSDLRHFSNLQVFCLSSVAGELPELDISGLEECANLQVLWIHNRTLKNLLPLSGMTGLQHLRLRDCVLEDFSPIGDLQNLAVLSLSGCRIPSLEAVRGLAALRYLDISRMDALPDLEPLTGTGITYLDMYESSPVHAEPMDAVLSDIPDLEALRISGNPYVDAEFCGNLLSGCTKLRFLDISGTPASSAPEELNGDALEIFVCS